MKMIARLLLTSLCSSMIFAGTLLAAGFSEAYIKDFQAFDERSGLATTSDAIYRTADSENWTALPIPKALDERIASAYFIVPSTGFVILTGSKSGQISLASTKDGGATWKRNDLNIAGIADLELDLESARVSGDPFGELRLTFRVPTSSNFVGRAVYHSTDGGETWQFAERTVEPNSEAEVSSVIRKGNWHVETNGECFGFKTGCIQTTRLFISGREATPPQVRAAGQREREAAQLDASNAPMFSAPGGSTRISLNRGFDKCQNSSVASMQLWWDNSYFFDANIYFSGRNRACSQTLTSTWVNQVSSMGWGLIPTVVGYQSPCTASATSAKFSFDPTTAEQQGRGEADIAAADAANIGLSAGSILYYDMERYDETVSTPGCRTASTAFLKGWTDRIKELGYKSGTYGSPKNAQEDWVTLPAASKMEAIWMARWDNVPNVWTYVSFPTFPTNEWNNHQRIKQWQAPHNETWGGVTFNIDGNIADGPVAGVPVPKNRNADFDGDGKSDISIFRPEDGNWWILKSSSSTISVTGFGIASDVLVPADYDGDGKTDIAVYRPSDGNWYSYGKGNTVSIFQWGTAGDVPVPGDFNGDGKADRAVYRPSSGIWYIFNSDSLSTVSIFQWGIPDDKPVVGDYDGDGKSDIAVYRPSTGVWYIQRSSDQTVTVTQWGISTDKLAPADYDGDGKTDIAIFRDGQWWINRSSAGLAVYEFGLPGDIPVSGNFDANASADVAVYRPSNGVWHLLRDQDGYTALQFGVATDRPIPNAYFPQ